MMRPMWIWNTPEVISSPDTVARLLYDVMNASVTDLFLYLDASHYDKYNHLIKCFNSAAHAAGLQVWALEGGRVYFSDADGPSHFYKSIHNMIDFNSCAQIFERFVGFSADHEPYAKGHGESFHNGVKDSELSCEPGTGVWKRTQAQDRAALMQDWVTIHQIAKEVLTEAGLLFAAAFPHWTCDYFGEPLQVRWPTNESVLRSVMEVLMELVDYYVVMSYHTEPSVAAARVVKELDHANEVRKCRQGCGPTVLAAVETTEGIGSKISYGDEPSKGSKKIVKDDIETIAATLEHHESFGGVAIHAWSGWSRLRE